MHKITHNMRTQHHIHINHQDNTHSVGYIAIYFF